MIKISSKGNFDKTFLFLRERPLWIRKLRLDIICQNGIHELKKATPTDSGLTADSWSYDIDINYMLHTYKISFKNSNIQNGIPIAVILDAGHATKNGGWIEGKHYINPAILPVFEKIVELAWKEVIRP